MGNVTPAMVTKGNQALGVFVPSLDTDRRQGKPKLPKPRAEFVTITLTGN